MTTVGEVKKQGKTGLEIKCSGCGWTVVMWWKLMGASDDDDISALINRLKCERCNCRPDPSNVRPYEQSDAYGFTKHYTNAK